MSDLDRSARAMTVLTAVSRLSGFARVLVFTYVFGKTYLANTYVSANTVPNILFELFAAGALQAVLVPTMVRFVQKGHEEAEEIAGTLLGLLCGALAFIGVAAAALAAPIMGLLVGDVRDAAVRQAEIELGAVFLWFFLPQLVFYGANIIATAVLNAHNRFALPVFAPALNNAVVITAYLVFDAMHEGPLTLDLTRPELWIVAGGTTLGVVVFCSLPVAAVWSRGFRLRPRWNLRHPALREILRDGAWAGVFLAATQLVQIVILKVANRVEGAPTAYQFAFVMFMLPHALFSVPVMTTRYPAMARAALVDDWHEYRRTVAGAVRSIAYLALAASAVSVAVAEPAARLLARGQGAVLAPRIADAAMAFAPGIAGFGLLLFFTRASYAATDARTPALVNLGVVSVTSTLMLVVVPRLDDEHLVTGLTGAHALGNVCAATILGLVVGRRVVGRGAARLGVGGACTRSVVAAGGAALAGWVVGHGVGWGSSATAVASILAGTAVAVVAYVGVQWMLGGPDPATAWRTLGAGEAERAT